MMKPANIGALKAPAEKLVGSSPTSGTMKINIVYTYRDGIIYMSQDFGKAEEAARIISFLPQFNNYAVKSVEIDLNELIDVSVADNNGKDLVWYVNGKKG